LAQQQQAALAFQLERLLAMPGPMATLRPLVDTLRFAAALLARLGRAQPMVLQRN